MTCFACPYRVGPETRPSTSLHVPAQPNYPSKETLKVKEKWPPKNSNGSWYPSSTSVKILLPKRPQPTEEVVDDPMSPVPYYHICRELRE